MTWGSPGGESTVYPTPLSGSMEPGDSLLEPTPREKPKYLARKVKPKEPEPLTTHLPPLVFSMREPPGRGCFSDPPKVGRAHRVAQRPPA